ncbi:D-arabinose 1-dehydrogenase [[Candida] jaroonii]|uniref:D-arabinose 1-dehydrogenase n=1 Tax=[Candida] jaroonii TaxID=467808 RepID=A0ACA9YDJ0_9ASCO|nr:D-arabinose 1-dehydrogenase [[Candida] jaroonii]
MKSVGQPLSTPSSIVDLPPLIIGGATFNYQYTDNPENAPIYEILDLAFSTGLIALDTSPYYGPSEILIGKALQELHQQGKWKRENYFICTKAGRVKLNDFDYSRESINASIRRSCERLGTSYLDLVYLHDIEFVQENDIYEALRELKLLKDQGIIKNFGVSGYPVDFLYKIALGAKNSDIGPLDAILSYSNGCIQNTILFDYYEKFLDCGIKKIMNGSILSMSLLRSGKTHDFHPAPAELKRSVEEVADYVAEHYHEDLAELATRFALKKWLFDEDSEWNNKVSIVLGLSNVKELKSAIDNYWKVKMNMENINDEDAVRFKKVQQLLGDHYNETWESGIEH